MAIQINKLYIHTAVVTHIYIYIYAYTAVNRARMCMPLNKNILVSYLVYKPIQTAVLYQYIYMYLPRIQLTTSRFSNLTRLIHITLL